MKRFQLERVSRILLAPDTKQIWESQAVFNPGTLREGEARPFALPWCAS